MLQIIAAVISVAVENDGARGYTSFVLLFLELNLIVWVGYYSDRNAGNAIKELQVNVKPVVKWPCLSIDITKLQHVLITAGAGSASSSGTQRRVLD